MSHERDGQLYCGVCSKPVGLTGQPAAYSSAFEPMWLCPYHNEAERRRIKAPANDET